MEDNSESLMEKEKTISPLIRTLYNINCFPTTNRKMYVLPHSLFRCLVHIQFSSLLVQEANPLHSQEWDTALLPSAAHTPRPHSAGSGCTAIQKTGVKFLTVHAHTHKQQKTTTITTTKKKPQILSLNLSHIIKSTLLRSHMLSLSYWSEV